jgi:MFS family permease
LTLFLCTILHAFTHAYATMLVPLYLMMRDDLHLKLVSAVSTIVTLYGIVYSIGSYGGGLLADRFDRKTLLGIGLLGNAIAIIAMGLTRQYELLIALGILAGIFGTIFHPAANALTTAHYPRSPGMAIGLLGIGSGLGFFAGPQYAGWRAQTAIWHFANITQWQKPCIELGVLGLIFGIIFLFVAREAESELHRHKNPTRPALDPEVRSRVIRMALILMLRDFTGVAGLSLLSLYLQNAFGYDVKHAGFVVGAVMLLSLIVSPLAVWATPGKRRLPALAGVMLFGSVFVVLVPFFSAAWVLPLMCAFQTCQLGSYALSDAAILERIAPAVRGRVVGLFLTIAGTFSALGPFVVGYWIDLLKHRDIEPHAYTPIFASLGVMLALSAFSTPIIAKLGPEQGPRIEPISETMPRTMEVVG